MANRLVGGCKSELILEHIWGIQVEICGWIVFESEAHNPRNCYYLGINQLFLMDMLIFKIKLENMASYYVIISLEISQIAFSAHIFFVFYLKMISEIY